MNKQQLKNCVSVDVETTGLDPHVHGLIEVGASLLHKDKTFFGQCYISDSCKVDPMALKVNGHSESELRARKDIESIPSNTELLLDLLEFCEEYGVTVIVGKNPKFDYNFLVHIWKNELLRNERDFPLSYRVINWGDLFIYKYLSNGETIPSGGLSSDHIAKLLGVTPEEKPHNGLNGALFNKKCIMKCFDYD